MAKVVRWRGQFADIDNTAYTVEIYGEDTGVAVKTITLGANPLVTNEDDNDDLFTPIRTQTGTLEVLDPDGTLMEEMMPADNLDHPVRVKKGNEIVWQGYLSCEAYSQDYTARQQVVEFNVASMLAAMKSREVGTTQFVGLVKIGEALASILSTFGTVYYPLASHAILDCYLQDMAFYSDVNKTNTHGNSETVIAGKTYYEVLEMICKFAGWVARENGVTLYLCEIGNAERTSSMAMRSFKYYGDQGDHTQTFHTAARKVTLSSNIEYQKVQMSLPKFPWNPEGINVSWIGNHPKTSGTSISKLYGKCQNMIGSSMFQLISMRDMASTINLNSSTSQIGVIQDIFGSSTVVNDWHNSARTLNSTGTVNMKAGARMVRVVEYTDDLRDIKSQTEEPSTRLMCIMFPTKNSATYVNWPNPIYEQAFYKRVYMREGKIKLSGNVSAMGMKKNSLTGVANFLADIATHEDKTNIYMNIRIGSKSYNENTGKWEEGDHPFKVYINDNGDLVSRTTIEWEKDGYYIRASTIYVDDNSVLNGNMEVSIYPIITQDGMSAKDDEQITMLLFNSLNVEVVDTPDRDESGSYITEFNTANKFSDDISIDVSISSDRYNGYAYNVIKAYTGDPISKITYGESSTPMQPELRLMNKIYDLYSVPRKTVSVRVKRDGTILPATIVTEGTRKFTAIEGERDWQMGRSTLKLIETI